jgi:hypothetical protein
MIAIAIAMLCRAGSFFSHHDRVPWGLIVAGMVITLAAQLSLSALGAAIGLTAGATGTNAATVRRSWSE